MMYQKYYISKKAGHPLFTLDSKVYTSMSSLNYWNALLVFWKDSKSLVVNYLNDMGSNYKVIHFWTQKSNK